MDGGEGEIEKCVFGENEIEKWVGGWEERKGEEEGKGEEVLVGGKGMERGSRV